MDSFAFAHRVSIIQSTCMPTYSAGRKCPFLHIGPGGGYERGGGDGYRGGGGGAGLVMPRYAVEWMMRGWMEVAISLTPPPPTDITTSSALSVYAPPLLPGQTAGQIWWGLGACTTTAGS